MLISMKDRRGQGRHAAVCLYLLSGHATIDDISMTSHANSNDKNLTAARKLR